MCKQFKNNGFFSIKTIIIALVLSASGVLGYLLYFSPQLPKPNSISITQQNLVPASPTHIPDYPDTIPGKVVSLKKLAPTLFFDYYENFSYNVRKDLEFPAKITFGYVVNDLSVKMERMKRGDMIAYCIFDNATQHFAGCLAIREKNPNDYGQYSMWIHENFRGGGRLQEALYLISKIYFAKHPETKSFNAHVRPWNLASIKAMEKFGFKKVGDFIQDGKVARYILELDRETVQKNKAKFE